MCHCNSSPSLDINKVTVRRVYRPGYMSTRGDPPASLSFYPGLRGWTMMLQARGHILTHISSIARLILGGYTVMECQPHKVPLCFSGGVEAAQTNCSSSEYMTPTNSPSDLCSPVPPPLVLPRPLSRQLCSPMQTLGQNLFAVCFYLLGAVNGKCN